MDYGEIYCHFLKSKLKVDRSIKVVFDTSNGTVGTIIEKLTRLFRPNIISTVINENIDGNFQAHGPNPILEGATNDAKLKIVETHSDLGVIYDGDGDRAVFLDNFGEIIMPHVIAMLLTSDDSKIVVDELVYNLILTLDATKKEKLICAKVGHLNIKEKMREEKIPIGVEFSGHYYFNDFFYLDSGLLATVKVLNKISELNYPIGIYNQKFPKLCIETFEAREHLFASIDSIIENLKAKLTNKNFRQEKRDGVTIYFDKEKMWANIRQSNTEPIYKITICTKDEFVCSLLGQEIKNIISKT